MADEASISSLSSTPRERTENTTRILFHVISVSNQHKKEPINEILNCMRKKEKDQLGFNLWFSNLNNKIMRQLTPSCFLFLLILLIKVTLCSLFLHIIFILLLKDLSINSLRQCIQVFTTIESFIMVLKKL